MFKKMQIDVATLTFRSLRLLLPLTIWLCHAWVAPTFRLYHGLAAAVFGLRSLRIDKVASSKFRVHNLKTKYLELLTHHSRLFVELRPGATRIESIPTIWSHGVIGTRVQEKIIKNKPSDPRTLEPLSPSGFTVIELIVVIVIIGILAATVLPRINFGSVSSQTSVAGAANMVRSDIRYAQEWAMANRTSKQIQFSQNSSTYSFSPAVNFDPSGQLPSVTGVLPVKVSSASVTFTFNSLGEPTASPAGVWTVSVSDGVTTIPITVTQYTGEVAY